MKFSLSAVGLLILFSACKKEYSCEGLLLSCHGDTTKQLIITAPRSADTLRYGQTYETTWIGKIYGATEYMVVLTWNDYSINASYSQLVGRVSSSECSVIWKIESTIFGPISNDDCRIVFQGIGGIGYIESARFSIKP